jgi:hypothetical protein
LIIKTNENKSALNSSSAIPVLPSSCDSNVEVKVKSLCLTKHHAINMYWGVEVQLHALLPLVIDGNEWSASGPGRFTSRLIDPGNH